MELFLAFLTSGFSTLIILFILAIFMLLNQDIKIPASGVFHAALILLLMITALDFGEELFAGRTSYSIQTLPLEQVVRYGRSPVHCCISCVRSLFCWSC